MVQMIDYIYISDSLQKGAKANSAQERKKEKSIRDRERTQGETAGEEEEQTGRKQGSLSNSMPNTSWNLPVRNSTKL
jgi:hypothetical protein